MKNKMLTYTYEGETVSVDLENGFIVTAIAKWHNEEKVYYAKFYINHKEVDLLDFVEEGIRIEAEMKNLRVTIAQYITNKLDEGFYDFYMNRFNEQMEIFDIGTEIYDAKDKKVTAND